jgi:hypothetical protein
VGMGTSCTFKTSGPPACMAGNCGRSVVVMHGGVSTTQANSHVQLAPGGRSVVEVESHSSGCGGDVLLLLLLFLLLLALLLILLVVLAMAEVVQAVISKLSCVEVHGCAVRQGLASTKAPCTRYATSLFQACKQIIRPIDTCSWCMWLGRTMAAQGNGWVHGQTCTTMHNASPKAQTCSTTS